MALPDHMERQGSAHCCRFAFPALKPLRPYHTSTGAQSIPDVLKSDEAAMVDTCSCPQFCNWVLFSAS